MGHVWAFFKKISFQWAAGALIVLAVFGVYANTLQYPFVWDDEKIVVANPALRDWTDIKAIAGTDVFGDPIASGKFYRPLQIFSYALEYRLWGLWPVGFRATNIILHSLNAALVLVLLFKLGIKKVPALAAALVFAIHPISIEAVTYISGRGEALFLLFSLLCVIAFLNGARGASRQYAWSIVFFALAIFSKESAIVVPFIIALYYALYMHRAAASSAREQGAGTLAALMTIAVAYAGARFLAMGATGASSLSLVADASLWERILTAPRIIITYIELLAFPRGLHMEYLFVEHSVWSPYALAGLPGIALAVWLSLRYIKPFKLSAFFVGWFFLGLGPFYNVVLPLSSTVREHWAYLSAIGFFALAALAGHRAYRVGSKPARVIILGLATVLLAYYAYATVDRNRDWSSPIALYSHDVRYEPKSFLLHNNLGVEQFRGGDMPRAKESFENSIAQSPRQAYDVAHNNLGVILEREGDTEAAIAAYEQSIRLGGYALAYGNLGRLYVQREEPQKAIPVLEQGIAKYPSIIEMRYYLGIAYTQDNRPSQAYAIFRAIEAAVPNYQDTRRYVERLRSGAAQ